MSYVKIDFNGRNLFEFRYEGSTSNCAIGFYQLKLKFKCLSFDILFP